MADLVRFHVFFQEKFDSNDLQNKNQQAVEEEFTSYSDAKRAAMAHFAAHRKPLVVCQSNPRRSRGDQYKTRVWLGD